MLEYERLLQWERDCKDARELLIEVFLQMQQFYHGKGVPDTVVEIEANLSWTIGELDEAEIRLHTFAIDSKADSDLRKVLGEEE